MKIAHYTESELMPVGREGAKGFAGRLVIGSRDGAKNFYMRFFEIAVNGYTPVHRHEWEHEIIIFSGKADFFNAGKWVPVSQGDTLFVPGSEEHGFKNTGDAPMVFACMVPSSAPEI